MTTKHTHEDRDFWERIVNAVTFDLGRKETARSRAVIAAHTASQMLDAFRTRAKVEDFFRSTDEGAFWCSDAVRYVEMRLGVESNLLFVEECGQYADSLLQERRKRGLPSYDEPCAACDSEDDEDDDTSS